MSDSNEVQTRKNEQDLICLLSCLVQSRRPDLARFQAMDLDGLWKMGEMHSVTAMLGTVLIPLLEADNRTAEAVRWKKAVNNARWKTVVMDAEKEELYRFLEKEGIWYLPLKGTVMMEYYPVYGIREMADIDILYDVRYDERVRKWFADRGYKIEMFRQGAHDTFIKAPVYNFEMHRTLFSKELPVWRAYFMDIRERLIKDEGNRHGWRLSNEDFYIYFIVHLYKHLQNAGYGVRALADLYLFQKENPDLDWNYIGVEMRKLGLTEEEKAIRSLPLKIFDQEKEPDLSQKERECMHLILSSGAYGNFDNKIRNALNKIRYERRTTSRFRLQMLYILERLYPTGPQYKDFYPVFYRYRLLFPLLPIYRFIRTFVKRKKGGLVKEELVSLLKVKKEETGRKQDGKQE